MTKETLQTDGEGSAAVGARQLPGLLQVWESAGPVCRTIPWVGELVLGREAPALVLDDPRTSRRHCKLQFDGVLWTVEDLDSRNGTYVDGARIRGCVQLDEGQTLRVGHCVFLVRADLRGREHVEVRGEMIVGGGLRVALEQASRWAAAGEPLLLLGPSGCGKRFMAEHVHALVGGGPLLHFAHERSAPQGLTAALREAVSAAGRGTLLITEIDLLGSAAQNILLRLCDPGVGPRLCVLARDDLHAALRKGRLREELYFRLHAAQAEVPPLTRRIEEVTFHIHNELASSPLKVQPSLIERCVRLLWPGNFRELRAEVRAAAAAAQIEGGEEIAARHLRPRAGEEDAPEKRQVMLVSAEKLSDPDRVHEVLRAEAGNVRAAARTLGVHRNQLRRWLDRQGVDPRVSLDGPSEA